VTTGFSRPSDGGVRELLAIALPMVVSQAAETAMLFTDRLFLSALSPVHMAAAMGGGLTAFMFMTFFIGLTGYATALVAQYLGAGKERLCGRALFQSVLCALLAAPVLAMLVPVGEWMMTVTGPDPAQLVLEIDYFRILMWGAGVSLLRNAMAAFWSGLGKTRIIMVSALASMVVNVVLNWLLIFGHLGFPAMGIRGAAIGTIIGNGVGLVIIAAAFAPLWRDRLFHLRSAFAFDGAMMKKLWRFGYPGGLEFLLNVLAFNLIVLTFHSYGVVEAAAVTIAFNWDMVSFIPIVGVGIGVTSLVGRCMGARNPDAAHRAAMSGLKVASVYTGFIVVVYLALAPQLVGIFVHDGNRDITNMARFMVQLVAFYVMADGFGQVFSGALRGAGDTFATMVISVSTHWLLAGLSFLAVRMLSLSAETSWLLVVGFVWCIAAALFVRWRSGKWRTIEVVDHEAIAPPPHDPAEVAGL